MRNVLIAATVLATSLTAACTHTYKVRTGAPLPEGETHHAMGALAGGAIGVVVGGGVGYAMGYAQGDDRECYDCIFSETAEEKGQMLGVVGAAGGLVTGAVIGGLVGFKDRYEYDQRAPIVTASVGADHALAAASWQF